MDRQMIGVIIGIAIIVASILVIAWGVWRGVI
jgi:hypothetical protein